MSEFLGEEFIRIHPDASTFRAELQTQVAAALAGVQTRLPAAVSATGAGATATAAAAAATRATAEQADATRRVRQEQQRAARAAQDYETNLGRVTRGTIASAAASTGLFRAVSFASGAFLAGAVAGAAATAALREFAEASRVAAQTARIIETTGGAANVTAEQVDKLANAQLRLTGIDDELIKSGANVILTYSAIRNEVGRGNDVFDRAVKAAIDISTVFGTSLRSSAQQVGKALQDPIRGVTALRRAGVTLSQSQRDLIKSLVESGQILTAQKIILGEVERQVGGTAEAVGKTLPGQFDILKQRAANALGDVAQRLSESGEAAAVASEAIEDLRGIFEGLALALGLVARGFRLVEPALGIIARLVSPVRSLFDVGRAASDFFRTGADSATGFRSALSELNVSMKTTRSQSETLAGIQEDLAGAQFDVRDATRDVHAAELALAASRAEPGSVERLALEDQLGAAEERLGKAQRDVAFQQRRLNRERAEAVRLQREQHDVINQTVVSLQQQFGEIKKQASARAGPLAPTGQLRDLREQMAALAETGTRAEKVIAGVIAAFTTGAGQRFPRADELREIVELAVRGGTTRSIFDALGLAEINDIELLRIRNAQALADGIGQENTALQEQLRSLRASLNAEKEIVKAKREAFNTAKAEADQARENLRIAEATVVTARRALADARQALADTIRSSSEAITDAVNSAKQNLRTLADAVADALGRIVGDQGQVSPALAERFRQLREQIQRGGGGDETRRAAQQVAFLSANRPDAAPQELSTRLADLADQMNRGGLTIGQFNRRLNDVLRDFKFDPRAFAAEFGTAARNDLLQQIKDLRAQAVALDAGPQRPGGGTAADIVRPLDVVAQTNRDIANATRDIRDRQRDLAAAERERDQARKDYERADKAEQIRHRRLLKTIADETKARRKLEEARQGNRPKPQGRAGFQAENTVAGVTAPR